jgi:hypothetical protein
MNTLKMTLLATLLAASSWAVADCNTQASNSAATTTAAAQHEQDKGAVLSDIIVSTSPDERAAMLTDFMGSALALNDKQKTDIGGINLEYAKRYNILMESTKPDEDKKTEFKRLSSEREAKIATLLTEAQMQAYKQVAKEIVDTYNVM